MAPAKKVVSTPKASVKKREDGIVKRPARGFHRFRNGVMNVTPKGGEKELVKRNQRSPLLRLPAEIRNQIWGYVVGYETLKAVWIKKGRNHYRRIIPPFPAVGNMLNVLCCCRQIYAEAGLLPYSLNTFTFWNYDRIKLDFNLLKPYQRAQITLIQLEATLVSGLEMKYDARMWDIAENSKYNLSFLPGLQQAHVLVDTDEGDQDAIVSKVKEELDVLLAGRGIKVVFEIHASTWSEYLDGWKTSNRIVF